MKLEVGMYVRTVSGKIRKIISTYENGDVFLETHTCMKKEDIKKSSYDILDLIEKEDIILYDDLRMPFSLEVIRDVHNSVMLLRIKNEEIKIKRILTHEEFEARSYKIGE